MPGSLSDTRWGSKTPTQSPTYCPTHRPSKAACRIAQCHLPSITSCKENIMARITVEDCLNRIPNRFQLTLSATYRARQLAQGGAPKVTPGRDKVTVTALREIAAGHVGIEMLKRVQV